ncbi:hypothetical protein [Marivita sp. S2033]|uniref:hypothetical protein n=1 Tax=Marivita sp. S2033 TaxID=3373187 RepID=UPI003982CD98
MSDPVTNVEIEDVLSSIRKLVAEESRSAPAPRKPAPEPERLVLTPAQRVDDPVPVKAPDPVLLTQPVDPPPRDTVLNKPIEEIPGTARLSDFGDVEGAFPDADGANDDHLGVAEQDVSDDTHAYSARQSELSRLIEDEVSAALTSPNDAFQSLSDRAALVHDDDDTAWDDLGFGDDQLTQDSESDEQAQEFVSVDEAEEVASEGTAATLSLEEKVAALGRLVARDTQEFEEDPETSGRTELAGQAEAMNWSEPAPFIEVRDDDNSFETGNERSNVLRSESAWPAPDADLPDSADEEPAEISAPPADDVSEDLALTEIDEALLREMVVDIVRQELQGALGERITRNVRKLVRREIHRMLIAQELD